MVIDDPLAMVTDAISKVAAGVEAADLVAALRQRLGRLGTLAHPGLRSDAPPGVHGLLPDDVAAPLLVVLEVLDRDGPSAAEECFERMFPTYWSG